MMKVGDQVVFSNLNKKSTLQIEIFEKSIAKSKKSDEIAERIAILNEYHTFAIYKNTCRGLFEKHKILFSLQMTVKIMESIGKWQEILADDDDSEDEEELIKFHFFCIF